MDRHSLSWISLTISFLVLQIQKWRKVSPRVGDEGVRVLEEAEGVTWVANVQSILVFC